MRFVTDNCSLLNNICITVYIRHFAHLCLGVQSFEVSLEEQKVTVRGDVTPEAVLEKVAKTGKKTEFWN